MTKAQTKDSANTLIVAYDYAYDTAKRLASVIDSRGPSAGSGQAKTLSYTWTPGGRLAQVQDSDGHVASFSYDATGRIAAITAPNNETIAFTWDAGGRLIEQRLNSGIKTTQSWFEDGSLKQQQNLFNTVTLSNHVYTIDNQGRRAGQTETIAGTAKTWSYLYDNLDRLTSASDGTAETYGYDIWGNRRSKTKAAVTTAYLYDAAHQLSEIRNGSDVGTLTGAAVHDADGHMTKLCEVSTGGSITKSTSDCTASGTGATTLALVWDALDHLNTATRTGANAVTENYAYDDSGRRIAKTSAGITTSYLYDGDDIHAEWNGSISGMPAAVYAHGAGIDEPLLRLTGTTNSPAATEAAYLADGLGSVVGTANISGTLTANQRFDAWGNKTASTGTTPTYGYTGREPDATGLTYFRARYQHSGLGRFVSRDPMGMVDAVSPYAYVGNNPVNFTDPSGLYAMPSFSGGSSGGTGDGKGPSSTIGNLTFLDFSAPTQQTVNAFGGNPFAGSFGESILVARADVNVWPRQGGGLNYRVTDDQGSKPLQGTFNTGTSLNINQLPTGNYSVSPRPRVPEPGVLGQVRDLFMGDRNRNAGNPTISNTDNWNQVQFSDGSIHEGVQIHPGRQGTAGGNSLGCLVCTQPELFRPPVR